MDRLAPSRDVNLELVRVIAIVLVVLLHANAGQFLRLGQGWWISNALNSISRVSVPLFIMVSGALLVPRQESVSRTMRRVARMAALIVVWTYIYAAWVIVSGEGFGFIWDRRITTLLDPSIPVWIARAPMMAHLHFLYGLLVFYMFLPMLQAVSASPFRNGMLAYVAIICFGANALSTVNSATGVSWFMLPGVEGFSVFVGYAAFGAITNDLRLEGKLQLPMLMVYGSATCLTVAMTDFSSHGRPIETFSTYGSPTVAIAAGAAFVALRSFQLSSSVNVVISLLGRLSFGVYFIHMIIIGIVMKEVWSRSADERVANVAAVAAITYCISLVAAAIVYSNRLSRRLIV